MKPIITIILFLSLAGCSDIPEELLQEAQGECEKFVLEKVANKFNDETHIFDTYTKDGNIVVEVGYREKSRAPGDDAYAVRICLYDDEERRITIPSLLDMGSWRK